MSNLESLQVTERVGCVFFFSVVYLVKPRFDVALYNIISVTGTGRLCLFDVSAVGFPKSQPTKKQKKADSHVD